MTLSTERIARTCARRPWATLGVWAVALVLGVGAIVALMDLTSEGEITSNPESEQGYAAMGRHFPPDPNAEYVNEIVVIRSARLTVDDLPSGARSRPWQARWIRAGSPITPGPI